MSCLGGFRVENCGLFSGFFWMGDLGEIMGFAHFGVHLVWMMGLLEY